MNNQLERIKAKFGKYLQPEDLKIRAVKDWKEIFSSELNQIFSAKSYGVDFKWIYRSRVINGSKDFPKYTKQMWAPPKRKVKDQGRCNARNESILYLSSHPTTTLFELKPRTGERLFVMEFKSLGEIPELKIVGVREIVRVNNDFQNIFKNHFKNSTEDSILIDDFLSIVFKSKTQFEPGYNTYNLTNAITQIFLHNQKGIYPKYGPAPRSIGLIYPSVETSKQLGVNVALIPRFAKENLKANMCYSYLIEEKIGENHYHVRLTHETSKIYPNGEMKWKPRIDTKTEYITDL